MSREGLLDRRFVTKKSVGALNRLSDGRQSHYLYLHRHVEVADYHLIPMDHISLGVVKVSELRAGINGVAIGYLFLPAYVSKFTYNSLLVVRPTFREVADEEIVRKPQRLHLVHKLTDVLIFSFDNELVLITTQVSNVFTRHMNHD
jgi:hypothetical protein